MLSAGRFSALLSEFHQLERSHPRGDETLARQGEVILDAFLRHTSYDGGAVYLRDPRSGDLRLAAKSAAQHAPIQIAAELPQSPIDRGRDGSVFDRIAIVSELDPSPRTILPLRRAREDVGLVALAGSDSGASAEGDLELVGAACDYLSVVLANQRLTSEMREGEFQLKYRLWELESLYDIGLSITATLNLDDLTDEVLVRTLSLLNARRAALYLRQGDRFTLRKSFGEVRTEFIEGELSARFATAVVDAPTVEFQEAAACIFPDCESFIAVPVRSSTEVVGILAAADREVREGVGRFTEDDVRLITRFASQAAIALENARLHRSALEKQAMEREIELAATIQRDILPRAIPEVEGYQIGALSRPARHLGGDYHAFFSSEGNLSVCVADVAGKSVPAAVLVSAFHAALQLLFSEGRDLGEIATELNRHIHKWSSETKFITLILATIDRETGILRFVNAGHNPGYLVSGGSVDLLRSNGLPIGIMSSTRYSTQTRKCAPGDLIVLYSDGITEAENPAGEEFEDARLAAVIEREAASSAAAVRDAISEEVAAFSGDAPQKDDQTLVVVKIVE
jgi:phosphoserine phosphatase RsbU/P